jgi:thioredoxin 1
MTPGRTDFVMLTDATFEKEVLKSPVPVVVIFGSKSSGGSYITLREVWEVVDVVCDHQEKIKIGLLDIEKNDQMKSLYQIREIPTLLFFKNGVVMDYLIGIIRRKELRTCLHTLLGR